ncbi:MAG: HD domain-containing protein [Candidatus Zixiibacteriota bacterium]
MKTVRTLLYNDCEFEFWELELLHTPILQRMYNLKQLGFADRIYPDAVHSRFNHILGVTNRADKIVSGVIRSLSREQGNLPPGRMDFEYNRKSIPIAKLQAYVDKRRPVVRLIALLHDIGHIPFGHTLEDEMHVFSVKHDNPKRQCQFFNILVREFVYALILRHDPNIDPALLTIVCKDEPSQLESDYLISRLKTALDRIKRCYQPDLIHEIHTFLVNLERAMVALFYLDDVHKERNGDDKGAEQERNDARQKAIGELFISVVLSQCEITAGPDQPAFNLDLDAFSLDIIGNTICADLLDYAKRDSRMSGLHYDYDDRIFRYFSLVSYKARGADHPMIRLCLQVFTNKLRLDVVSEIVTILRARYLLSERVIFHPTKCAAGAMLGTAVSMMGIREAELNFFRIGDAVFMAKLEQHVVRCLQITKEVRDYTAVDAAANKAEVTKFLTCCKNPDQYQPFESVLETLSTTLKSLPDRSGITMALLKICTEELAAIEVNANENLFGSPETAKDLAEKIVLRLTEASRLMWQIQARQYYDLVFRVSRIDKKTNALVVKELADKFKNPAFRFKFERRVEHDADLKYGSLVIHCPKSDTSLKEANVLVFGSDPKSVIEFSAIKEEHELHSLSPHIQEAIDLASAYKRIWNMYFFVQEAQMYKWPLIEEKIRFALTEIIGSDVSNCDDLHRQLKSTYGDVAFHLIRVVEYMQSSEKVPKVPLTPEFVEFVEGVTPHGRKVDISPETVVKQWLAIYLRPEEKSDKK